MIPPPSNGWCYTEAEVATLLNRKPENVRNLSHRGRLDANRNMVTLHSLAVPVRHYAPEDVRGFIQAVNGRPVKVMPKDACGATGARKTGVA